MNNVKFPVYPNHHGVKCFHCGRPIGGKHYVSEYPSGRYYKDCSRCTTNSIRTYYDIEESEVVPSWLK